MMEFLIKSDETVSKTNYSIWISFKDESIHSNTFYMCSGTALIVPNDDHRCWFDFHFHHTPDWKEIINLSMDAPGYVFSQDELERLGNMIAILINHYIAKHN